MGLSNRTTTIVIANELRILLNCLSLWCNRVHQVFWTLSGYCWLGIIIHRLSRTSEKNIINCTIVFSWYTRLDPTTQLASSFENWKFEKTFGNFRMFENSQISNERTNCALPPLYSFQSSNMNGIIFQKQVITINECINLIECNVYQVKAMGTLSAIIYGQIEQFRIFHFPFTDVDIVKKCSDTIQCLQLHARRSNWCRDRRKYKITP